MPWLFFFPLFFFLHLKLFITCSFQVRHKMYIKRKELRCLEQLVKPLILKQMWCDESYAAVARYSSKEWYKSSIGKKGFVVLCFVCKCCSGTRCSWLW